MPKEIKETLLEEWIEANSDRHKLRGEIPNLKYFLSEIIKQIEQIEQKLKKVGN